LARPLRHMGQQRIFPRDQRDRPALSPDLPVDQRDLQIATGDMAGDRGRIVPPSHHPALRPLQSRDDFAGVHPWPDDIVDARIQRRRARAGIVALLPDDGGVARRDRLGSIGGDVEDSGLAADAIDTAWRHDDAMIAQGIGIHSVQHENDAVDDVQPASTGQDMIGLNPRASIQSGAVSDQIGA